MGLWEINLPRHRLGITGLHHNLVLDQLSAKERIIKKRNYFKINHMPNQFDVIIMKIMTIATNGDICILIL